MSRTPSTRVPSIDTRSGPRPQASRRDDTVTMALATWLVVGLFADGWAHNTLPSTLDSFWTPWHGLLYSGFLATATWMASTVYRNQTLGRHGLAAVPVGYGWGLVGVAVFLAGGVADSVWHTLLGIEADFEALVSPPHLVLLVGALTILSTPLRGAWQDPALPRLAGWRLLAPALASTWLVTLTVAFFLQAHSALRSWAPTAMMQDWITGRSRGGDTHLAEVHEVLGAAEFMLTTLVLLVPVCFLLRRWRLPFGAVASLWTSTAFAINAMHGFDLWPAIAAALAAGLFADALLRRLDPGPQRPGALRIWALVAPMALWALHVAALWQYAGIGWSVPLWSGVIVLSGLVGLAIGFLTAPPLAPDQLRTAQRATGAGQTR